MLDHQRPDDPDDTRQHRLSSLPQQVYRKSTSFSSFRFQNDNFFSPAKKSLSPAAQEALQSRIVLRNLAKKRPRITKTQYQLYFTFSSRNLWNTSRSQTLNTAEYVGPLALCQRGSPCATTPSSLPLHKLFVPRSPTLLLPPLPAAPPCGSPGA